jgi:ZIP family zinc transporter
MPRIIGMWTVLTLLCAAMAALGYAVADEVPDQGLYAEAFAAGAVLTMLADSMMPEGFEHGGKTVGLLTVFGFFVAGVLTVLD